MVEKGRLLSKRISVHNRTFWKILICRTSQNEEQSVELNVEALEINKFKWTFISTDDHTNFNKLSQIIPFPKCQSFIVIAIGIIPIAIGIIPVVTKFKLEKYKSCAILCRTNWHGSGTINTY